MEKTYNLGDVTLEDCRLDLKERQELLRQGNPGAVHQPSETCQRSSGGEHTGYCKTQEFTAKANPTKRQIKA